MKNPRSLELGSVKERGVVDAKLVQQWEPKIHQMLRDYPVCGMEREDLEQELRKVIIKTLKRFDPSRASYHTYLHRSLITTIFKLRAKAAKNSKNSPLVEIPYEEDYSQFELLEGNGLSSNEKLLAKQLLAGYSKHGAKAMWGNKKDFCLALEGLKQKFASELHDKRI